MAEKLINITVTKGTTLLSVIRHIYIKYPEMMHQERHIPNILVKNT